jgi:hypothetical protein
LSLLTPVRNRVSHETDGLIPEGADDQLRHLALQPPDEAGRSLVHRRLGEDDGLPAQVDGRGRDDDDGFVVRLAHEADHLGMISLP